MPRLVTGFHRAGRGVELRLPMQMRKKVQFNARMSLSCLLATLVLVLAGPARGESTATEQAKQHYETGSKQYDLGHWDDAIQEYEKAYELRPDPNFLYNLAQAYRRKGDARRALDLYRNYLVKTPKTPLRAEIEERIKTLQKQIEEANSAKPAAEPTATPIVPPPSPPVDTNPIAATASPPAGAELTPEPQAVTTPISPPAEPAGQAAPVAFATPSGPTAVVVDTAAIQPAPRGRGLRIAGIASGAVGVAAVVVGVVLSAQAKNLSNKVTSASQFNPSDDSAGLRAERWQVACYGVGALAIGAGAVLYYLGVRSARVAPPSLSLSPVLGPGTAGVSAMGVF